MLKSTKFFETLNNNKKKLNFQKIDKLFDAVIARLGRGSTACGQLTTEGGATIKWKTLLSFRTRLERKKWEV